MLTCIHQKKQEIFLISFTDTIVDPVETEIFFFK